MQSANNIPWELRNIRKTFGPVVANDDVSLVLRSGQIHGLVGENGSGKSTLIKTLSGAHQPDSGEILCQGRPVVLYNPLVARSLGLATVFQEFSLVPHLSVAENIHLGRWLGGPFNVDWQGMREEARRVLADLAIDISPDALIRDLPVAQQQMAEIAKAMAAHVNAIVLDEPTAALGPRETEHFHDLLRRLRASGAAILYISHRIDQIVQVADAVTVMRNGRVISAADATPVEVSAIITLMIGKEVAEHYPKVPAVTAKELLRVERIATCKGVRDVTFTLHRGEVLGLGGVLGSGRTEIARALFGAEPLTAGEIRLLGHPVHLDSPAQAIAAGIALLAENRKTDGIFFNFTGAQNITVAALDDFDHGLWFDLRREQEVSRALVQRLEITAGAESALMDHLSGGNQQKILVARWINADAEVFILDEPTQGIDIGAKIAIYQLINEFAAAGKGVILISSDDKELLAMSDRVAIVRRGHVERIVPANQVTKADLLEAARSGRGEEQP